MASGISVEFCSHVAVSFVENSVDQSIKEGENGMDPRTRAVSRALKSTGSSVLSGITLTKLGGVVVLAFAKSQIFSVYYFRLYLGILVLGAYHGLLVLPVLLSLFGRVKSSSSSKSGLKQCQSTGAEEGRRTSSSQEATSSVVPSETIVTTVAEVVEEKNEGERGKVLDIDSD